MNHGDQEPLVDQPFAGLAERLGLRPGAAEEIAARVQEGTERYAGLSAIRGGIKFPASAWRLDEFVPLTDARPLSDQEDAMVRALGGAASLIRESMVPASCPVCHETTCRQPHEVVFEGVSYWCGQCGYCEPDSTHEACSGTLRRVRVTARVDDDGE
jgi:predicted RNA-binding Zn-ribbon protein involved in translation (DUF1610 family)